ncbi:MAG: hypothetical protein OXD44_06865 [Gammaproteobacteria bacterium]|nr:hypothetical protein [Gammaproteobacteria bacterium]
MAEPTNHELATEIAVLKQTMETHKQEYKTDIARLAEQMANWKTDMANWKTDMARRDKSNLQWIAGFILGSAVLVITVLGFVLNSGPTP